MSSGFLPERIIRTRNRDGSYTHSEVYSYENWSNIQFATLVFIIAFVIIIAPFASLIFFLIYLFTDSYRDKEYAFVALIISLYFVIDFFNGWVLNSIICFFSEKEIEVLYVSLNLAVLCSSILTMIFSKDADDAAASGVNFNKVFIGLAIGFGSFAICGSLFENKVLKIPSSYYENETAVTSDKEPNISEAVYSKNSNDDEVKKNPVLEKNENLINTDASLTSNDIYVSVGNQQWAKQNLHVTYFRNGDIIPEAATADEWETASTEKRPAWCYADGNSNEILYNWYAVSDNRGLAPEGWHIPQTEEWFTLYNELGGYPHALHQLTVKGFFNESNQSGVEFNAMPVAVRYDFGSAYSKEPSSNWWTSDFSDSTYAYYQTIKEDCFKPGNENISKWGIGKGTGMSVRCIKD